MFRRNKYLHFLEGIKPITKSKLTVKKILQMSDEELESNHNYIQWAFPTNEYSMFNVLATPLTDKERKRIMASRRAMKNYKALFARMMAFYNLHITEDEHKVLIPVKELHWLTPNNHNYLRITRILKSLMLLGETDLANSLYAALVEIYMDVDSNRKINMTSFAYWSNVCK